MTKILGVLILILTACSTPPKIEEQSQEQVAVQKEKPQWLEPPLAASAGVTPKSSRQFWRKKSSRKY